MVRGLRCLRIRRCRRWCRRIRRCARPASASSSEDRGGPQFANDGSSTTRWSSAFADNQWWQVDLGSVRQVDTVSFNWEAAYASSYKIQISSDGSTFTDAANVSNTQPGWKTDDVHGGGGPLCPRAGRDPGHRVRDLLLGRTGLRARGGGGGTVPVNISPPSIDGFAGQGQTLTASVGRARSGAPTSYAYQWQRCDNCRRRTVSAIGRDRVHLSGRDRRCRADAEGGGDASNGAGSRCRLFGRHSGRSRRPGAVAACIRVVSRGPSWTAVTRMTGFDDAVVVGVRGRPVVAGRSRSVSRWTRSPSTGKRRMRRRTRSSSPPTARRSPDRGDRLDLRGWLEDDDVHGDGGPLCPRAGRDPGDPYGISFWDAQVFGPASSKHAARQ